MVTERANYELEVIDRIDAVAAADWDALVGDDNPFIEHAFLAALETSGSVGKVAGWVPCHLLIRSGDRLVGATPLYLKDNSFGEYIFDWGWAEAFEGVGLRYYPKLVSAVPFTPVTGPRLLVAEGADKDSVIGALVRAALELAEATRASSIHWLFVTETEQRALQTFGFFPRLTHQFHWKNRGWSDFDAFLDDFRSPARKNVRRERRRASESGLTLHALSGEELSDDDWAALYRFYRDTSARKWGDPYLNRAFFSEIRSTFAHRVLVTLARDEDGRAVAGALNFHKGDHLYGRYWGCVQRHADLHFELCYYQLIDFAIERGLKRFEAGAQGPHKIRRGLIPKLTYNAHFIGHPEIHQAFASAIAQQSTILRHELQTLKNVGPFKRS